MFSTVELREIRVFLTLAEELHYGRSAERLLLTPARVSQTIQTLEAKLGGRLFERTSRRVALTPLGAKLNTDLRPLHNQLMTVLESAARGAAATAGALRVGVTPTSDSPAVLRLVDAFEQRHPECRITIEPVDIFNPFSALRSREIDVLCNWLAVDDQPDLKAGPVIEQRDRFLAVGACHPLAVSASVSVEDLADEHLTPVPETFPRALGDALLPPQTPSGRPISRANFVFESLPQNLALIARGRIVAPTVSGITVYARDDIVLIPIRDMPPLPLGLIWCTTQENARIRALAAVARALNLASGERRPTETAGGSSPDSLQPA